MWVLLCCVHISLVPRPLAREEGSGRIVISELSPLQDPGVANQIRWLLLTRVDSNRSVVVTSCITFHLDNSPITTRPDLPS